MTDSSGRQVTFAYSGSQVTSIDFPRDRSLTLAYDAEGDLISTSEGETQWRFTYDGSHHLVTMTDPLGRR